MVSSHGLTRRAGVTGIVAGDVISNTNKTCSWAL